ncbi:MAG: hypothetical protein PHS49_05610, partial [Candidatus Gracilibacteria bacterium]|nr:hypothetical protein [Candidatus Gracilibacteria bacterium]
VNTYESELFSVGNRLVDNKFYSKDKKRYFTIEDSSDLLFNATLNIQGNKYDLGNYMLDIYKPHFLNNNNDVSFTAIYTDNSTTNSGSLKYFFINDKYIGFDDIYYKENFGYNGVKLIGRKGNKIEKMVCNTGGNVSKQIAVKNLILSANNLNTLNGGIDIKTNIDKLSKKELLGNEENILKLLDKYSDLIYTTKFITLEYLYNKIVYLKLNN